MQRDRVKLGIIIVGFATAATFTTVYLLSDGPEPVTPDDVGQVDLVCVESGEHVRVSADLIASHGFANAGRPPRPSAESETVEVITYPVPECGEQGAVIARYCTPCDQYFPRDMPDGTRGVCPICGQ